MALDTHERERMRGEEKAVRVGATNTAQGIFDNNQIPIFCLPSSAAFSSFWRLCVYLFISVERAFLPLSVSLARSLICFPSLQPQNSPPSLYRSFHSIIFFKLKYKKRSEGSKRNERFPSLASSSKAAKTNKRNEN